MAGGGPLVMVQQMIVRSEEDIRKISQYVEDFTYTGEVRMSTLDCSNFTNPYQMLEFTQMRLAQYAKPRISYVLSAMDLPIALTAGDEVALLASARECLKNGQPAGKHGFFQYSAAGDSKHPVTLEDKKSARLLFRFQEMQEGGDIL